jgi:hypothetical protein
MSTIALLKTVAPEFASESDETIEAFLGYAALQMSPTNWNGLYSLGCAYLAAHMLKTTAMSTDGDTVGGGPISAERVGDLSRSFQNGGTANWAWKSTRYGIEYLRLRALIPGGPLLVSADDA